MDRISVYKQQCERIWIDEAQSEYLIGYFNYYRMNMFRFGPILENNLTCAEVHVMRYSHVRLASEVLKGFVCVCVCVQRVYVGGRWGGH